MRKLKNPVKYIQRLKSNIAWLQGVRERVLRENAKLHNEIDRIAGSLWFKWSNPLLQRVGYTKTITVDGMKVGQNIIMLGKITEIHQTKDGNMAVMEFTEVRTRQELRSRTPGQKSWTVSRTKTRNSKGCSLSNSQTGWISVKRMTRSRRKTPSPCRATRS